MKTLLRGGIAGLLATGLMSLVMLAARAGGLMHTPPPKQITASAERKSGALPPSPSGFHASWLAAHAGYGAGCGAVYALLRPLLPGPLGGLLYGLIVWGVSYLGLMPALGLYPWPDEDSPSRTASMIAAHLVFGASLAQIEPKL